MLVTVPRTSSRSSKIQTSKRDSSILRPPEVPIVAHLRGMKRYPGTIGPLTINLDGRKFQVGVRDFTVAGAGFLTDMVCPTGASLVIESGRRGKPEVLLAVQVCHITMLADGSWVVGCRFSRFLTLKDLRAL